MASFEMATSDVVPFWEWLKKRRPDDHKVMELWIAVAQPSSYRTQMEKKELLFTLKWVQGVQSRAKVKSKLGFLTRLQKQYEDESTGSDPKEFSPSESLKKELIREIDPILDELKETWEEEEGGDNAERKEEARKRAAARLMPARARQKEALRRSKEGTFWFTEAAPDGQPFLVLGTSLQTRPPPSLIAMGKPPSDTKPSERPVTATGDWFWDDGTLYVRLVSGPTTVIPKIGDVLGVRAEAGAPRRAAVTIDSKLMSKLATVSRLEALGKGGHFWFIKSLPDTRKPALLVRRMKARELDTYLAEVDHVYGTWLKDGRVVTLKLLGERASDRQMADLLAKTVWKARTFGPLPTVDIVGRGFHFADPRTLSLPDDPSTVSGFADLRRRLETNNRTRARDASGHLWFTQFGVDDAPAFVLYPEGRSLPFDKADLVSADPRKARAVVEGTWTRDAKAREVHVELFGTAGAVLRGALRIYLQGAGVFKEKVVFGDKNRDVDAAFANLRRTIEAATKRTAQDASGNLWFAQFARDDKPLLVLYRERNLPHEKEDVCSADPSKARCVVGGTWKRDPKLRTVTFSLVGLGATSMRAAVRTHIRSANLFRETEYVFP